MDDLNRHGTPERRLLGFVDAPHTPDADDLLQKIATADNTTDKRVRGSGSPLLVGWRLLFLRFSRITWPEQRILLLGTSPLACELAEIPPTRERKERADQTAGERGEQWR